MEKLDGRWINGQHEKMLAVITWPRCRAAALPRCRATALPRYRTAALGGHRDECIG